MSNDPRNSIALAMTGASGAAYGLRLLQCLLDAGEQVHLMISRAAQMVIDMETEVKLSGTPQEMSQQLTIYCRAKEGQLHVWGKEQWHSPVASGSGAPRAMVVCPCTSAFLSAAASGASADLMERAADVAIKEQRKLILVHRETPVSAIHLENSLKLARMGVTILPANPGFYLNPKTVDDLVDFVVARILDHLDVDHALLPRWGE
ncbi:flavin prenyltransferase UbiX [Pseudomonadota bacterium]